MAFRFHTAANLFQHLQTRSPNTHRFQTRRQSRPAHLLKHMLAYSAIGMLLLLLLQTDGGLALRPRRGPWTSWSCSGVNVSSQHNPADHRSMFPQFGRDTDVQGKPLLSASVCSRPSGGSLPRWTIREGREGNNRGGTSRACRSSGPQVSHLNNFTLEKWQIWTHLKQIVFVIKK